MDEGLIRDKTRPLQGEAYLPCPLEVFTSKFMAQSTHKSISISSYLFNFHYSQHEEPPYQLS